MTKCIMQGCDKPRYARGLCRPHYTAFLWRVKKGEITWAELVAEGYAIDGREQCTEVENICEKVRAKRRDLPGQIKMAFATTSDDLYGGTTLLGDAE